MTRLAVKNLLIDPARLAVSVGGVAAALFLVLLLDAVFAGSAEQMVDYTEESDAGVWVMQEGVANMHMATSVLPLAAAEPLRAMPDVDAVTPILYASNPVEAGDVRQFSYVVGLPSNATLGAPWAMAEGKSLPEPGEAILPRLLARKAGVGIGDEASILGRPLRVVGLSDGTYSLANSITFVSYEDMADLLATPGIASYLLVRGKPGVARDALADRIEQAVPGTNAMTQEALAASDRDLARQMGTDLIGIMSLIGFVVGLLVIGLTVYTATVRQARDYGVAKALGMKSTRLLGVIWLQTLTLAVLGLGLAVGAAYLARPLIETVAPDVPLIYLPGSFVRLALTATGIALLAALSPAYRIARIDPAMVFKE